MLLDSPLSMALRARNRAFRRLLSLPPRWLRRLAGQPVVVEGQRLDLHVQLMLRTARVVGYKDIDDVALSRELMDRESDAVAPAPKRMARLREIRIPRAQARSTSASDPAYGLQTTDSSLRTPLEDVQLPARLYFPETATSVPPLLVFFHGGGFVVGSIRSHDAVVRELADLAAVAILSVEYRLSPENKAPLAVDDAYHAYRWARDNAAALGVDPERVGVGGDSAGANLSALLSHRCRDRDERIPDVQMLLYPATDLTCTAASHETFAQGFFLEEARLNWFLRQYLVNDGQRRSAQVSPLYAERFDELPPTILVTAGFDPLRDEGAAYAEKLREAGVPVTYRCEHSLIHGFFNLSGVVPAARSANEAIAADLRRALGA